MAGFCRLRVPAGMPMPACARTYGGFTQTQAAKKASVTAVVTPVIICSMQGRMSVACNAWSAAAAVYADQLLWLPCSRSKDGPLTTPRAPAPKLPS
jgi:hypothetical protein